MTQSGRVANLSSLVMGMLLWLLCCFDGFIAVANVGWCVYWQLQNGSRRGYSHLKKEEYEYESNLFTIYSRRVTIEADITLVFLFHN